MTRHGRQVPFRYSNGRKNTSERIGPAGFVQAARYLPFDKAGEIATGGELPLRKAALRTITLKARTWT